MMSLISILVISLRDDVLWAYYLFNPSFADKKEKKKKKEKRQIKQNKKLTM